jgi:hypothetical protein
MRAYIALTITHQPWSIRNMRLFKIISCFLGLLAWCGRLFAVVFLRRCSMSCCIMMKVSDDVTGFLVSNAHPCSPRYLSWEERTLKVQSPQEIRAGNERDFALWHDNRAFRWQPPTSRIYEAFIFHILHSAAQSSSRDSFWSLTSQWQDTWRFS